MFGRGQPLAADIALLLLAPRSSSCFMPRSHEQYSYLRRQGRRQKVSYLKTHGAGPRKSRAVMLHFLLHIALHCQLFISSKATVATGSICLPARRPARLQQRVGWKLHVSLTLTTKEITLHGGFTHIMEHVMQNGMHCTHPIQIFLQF